MKHKLTPFDLALWAALPMAHTSKVEGRLRLILNRSRNRKTVTHGAWGLAVILTLGTALTVATAETPPRSLMAAITSIDYTPDMPARRNANIAFFQAQIVRFGDTDPWAGKAYYVLGNAQVEAGRYDAALASYDKAIALPEPPYVGSDIHSAARYERINTMDCAGRHIEAAAKAEALIKNGGQGLISADLWANLRERWPEFQMMRDNQINREAEQAQYRSLVTEPRWTKTLPNGVTVQLLGVMQTAGNVHTVWSPGGQFVSKSIYKSLLGEDGYLSADSTRKFRLILRFAYPAEQAILTEYALSGAVSSSFQSGLTRNNGNVATDEAVVNTVTAGQRTVESWFPVHQIQTNLRVGIALVPPPAGPTDPADAPKEWAEFSGITLPTVKP